MGLKFNPLTAQFDLTGSGGGGASYIDGEVATYNDLPLDGTAALNSAWLVRNASGVWPVSRKQAGIYIRTATAGSSRDADYTYAGTMPDVFSDAVFTLYDDASTTRTGQFNLGSITAGQNRVLTWPDGNGTIARTSDIPSTFAASAITSGVLDNARINFAAPSAIGSTTAAAITGTTGTFSTLSANNGTITASSPVLDLAQTWNNASVAFTGVRLNITNTASAAASWPVDFQVGGSSQFRVRRSGGGVEIAGTSSGVRISDYEITGLGGGLAIRSASGSTGFNFDSGAITTQNANTNFVHDGVLFEQRRTTSPVTMRLYSTFTSTTSFERLNIAAQTGGNFIVGTEKGSGGGTARGLELRTDNVARITIGSAGQIGFYGAAAAAQPAAVADATDAATVITQLNALLSRLRTIGIIAT